MVRPVLYVALAVTCFAASTAAQQQYNAPKTVRQATAGESCETSHRSCLQWCDTNRGANNANANASCKSSCSTYQATCEKTGIWSTPLGTTEVRGLPPK